MHQDAEENSQLKWDNRFRNETCVLGIDPSRYLVDHLDLIMAHVPGTKALDVACGEGRNSIFLAKRGFQVSGLDISAVGLEKGRQWMEREGVTIDFRAVNLERYEFTEQYDLILNCNFLLRNLIPKSVAALSSGGILVFDTLVDSPFVPNNHSKEHLLQPGELVRIFQGFPGKILTQEEKLHDEMPTAKLIFQKK
ncbi:MAG: class I SAM-dependent methyltransferase [Deltaproteobacteria bacterium]|nr:class I SAM-dependent methyltransferase [Deltaproteobacteria bacterium]TLN02558.1 MAG: class I SAM-dependent methyltransferase [bacterium]